MTNKFSGELSWIDPDFLVTEAQYNKVESFFLGLGVVFNDLKSIVAFEKILNENYEKPEEGDVTSHAGNYGGLTVYTQKLIAGTLIEFFIFLKKNTSIFNTNEFREVFTRISAADRQLWKSMIAAAHGNYSNASDLLKTIVQVRNNIAFHYDHSGKILRNAYISRFFGKTTNERTERAYFSIGETIATTRFYFSDAAIEESIYIAAGKKPKEDIAEDKEFGKYRQQVSDTIQVVAVTIASLMKNWIQLRRNLPW